VLVELSIRDLALIEAGNLALGPGLNVVTGETGAGKSLFVGSLELVRGETPKGGASSWIRKGADEARVEATFHLAGAGAAARVREVLAEEVPALSEELAGDLSGEGEGGCELILGRTLTRAGRTRAHLNQRPVPRRALARLAQVLIEIHGQNDHQELLDERVQLELLDLYGGCGETLSAYDLERERWLALQARRSSLEGEQSARVERADLLRFQTEELAALAPRAGEHGQLLEERELLRSANELQQELGGVVHGLESDEDAVLDRLRGMQQTLERWSERVPRLAETLEELAQASIHLEEVAGVVRNLLEGVESDPQRLEQAEGRLAEYERLTRKYRIDADQLVERREEIERELFDLEHTDEALAEVEAELRGAEARLEKAGKALTRKRLAPVKRLTAAVHASLAQLGLENARFDVVFSERAPGERFGPRGLDQVAFHLAANPGEDPGPLARVASGGEAARIMLALRTVLSAEDAGRTLVFDEIDAGVGGRLGPEVARHLEELGEKHQVLCVTHLPAIAARASLHLHACKEVRDGRTRTSLVPLAGEERIREVADMIAGGADQETARAEARRLLEGDALTPAQAGRKKAARKGAKRKTAKKRAGTSRGAGSEPHVRTD